MHNYMKVLVDGIIFILIKHTVLCFVDLFGCQDGHVLYNAHYQLHVHLLRYLSLCPKILIESKIANSFFICTNMFLTPCLLLIQDYAIEVKFVCRKSNFHLNCINPLLFTIVLLAHNRQFLNRKRKI